MGLLLVSSLAARNIPNAPLHRNVSHSPSSAMCAPMHVIRPVTFLQGITNGLRSLLFPSLPFQAGHGHPHKSARKLTARLQAHKSLGSFE